MWDGSRIKEKVLSFPKENVHKKDMRVRLWGEGGREIRSQRIFNPPQRKIYMEYTIRNAENDYVMKPFPVMDISYLHLIKFLIIELADWIMNQ